MRLHHVNIVSNNMPELDEFYLDVLGLEKMPQPPMYGIDGYSVTVDGDSGRQPATFINAGDPAELQLHLCLRDPDLARRYNQPVNPVLHGHIAFRCDDIEAVKERLRANDIPFADYGVWAMKGWYQIFLFDPVGTVVEIHQVVDDDHEN